MNNGEFAQIAAHIAKKAAAWSADSLILPENIFAPVSIEAVERFAAEIKNTLDHMLADARRNSALQERRA